MNRLPRIDELSDLEIKNKNIPSNLAVLQMKTNHIQLQKYMRYVGNILYIPKNKKFIRLAVVLRMLFSNCHDSPKF